MTGILIKYVAISQILNLIILTTRVKFIPNLSIFPVGIQNSQNYRT